jgi:hypothetical protein
MEDREGKELTNEICTPQFSKLESINTASSRSGEEVLEIWNEATFTGATRPIYAWHSHHPPLVPGDSGIPSCCESKEATFQVPKPQPQGS